MRLLSFTLLALAILCVNGQGRRNGHSGYYSGAGTSSSFTGDDTPSTFIPQDESFSSPQTQIDAFAAAVHEPAAPRRVPPAAGRAPPPGRGRNALNPAAARQLNFEEGGSPRLRRISLAPGTPDLAATTPRSRMRNQSPLYRTSRRLNVDHDFEATPYRRTGTEHDEMEELTGSMERQRISGEGGGVFDEAGAVLQGARRLRF